MYCSLSYVLCFHRYKFWHIKCVNVNVLAKMFMQTHALMT